METKSTKIEFQTKKQLELVDITAQIKAHVAQSGVSSGIAVVYNPHTTGAICINHNEPLLIQDIMKALFRLVPVDINYSHDLFELHESRTIKERSNGHAHVKSFLLGSSETFLVEGGQLVLGQKQSIFFVELDGGRPRYVHVKVVAG